MAKNKPAQSVVRNAAYKKSEFSIRERHNERLNESYHNADIDISRAHLNVHFCENVRLDDNEDYVIRESYEETFNRLIAEGKISTKGLKKDGSAKVFDELVFDVNTDYFDRNGGYDYAKSFFEEAYRMAVQEVGGEDYILSAVMHADERNKALSEELGRDVYHYHLHVVYVPVVDKEVLWTKRCKDPALVGTVKEVIKQVSHSKKWPRFKDGNGWVNSYSLLQDRYHDHMKQAGFVGFERGERGSTTEHLETLDYKIQQDKARAAALDAVISDKQETATSLDTTISGKEQTVAKLDKKAEVTKKRLADLTKTMTAEEKVVAQFEEIEKIGHKRGILGGITIPDVMWKKIIGLVKEAFNSRDTIWEFRKSSSEQSFKITELEKRLKAKDAEKPGISDSMQYIKAKSRAPQRLAEVVADIMRKPPEQPERERTAPQQKRSTDLDR